MGQRISEFDQGVYNLWAEMDLASTIFTGAMRPNDARRFLIEAMIGAMHADGVVEPREMQLLHQHIASHPMLRGLTPSAVTMMIEMASEAIRYATNARLRIPSIARGLPMRIHRLAAFAMACEICAVDGLVVDSERIFIEELRIALRVSTLETENITQAIEQNSLLAYLSDRLLRIRSLIPLACELFTIRALTKNQLNDNHRFALRDFFLSLPDIAATADELDGELYQSFRRPRNSTHPTASQIAMVASHLPDPVDRYWMVVYGMAAEPTSTLERWKVIPFIGLLQIGFQIVDADMDRAAADAALFPASLRRPS